MRQRRVPAAFLPLQLVTLLALLLLISTCARQQAREDSVAVRETPPEPAFTPLLDSAADFAEWQPVNADDASFSFRDGILEVRGDQGWLRSPRLYADFVLRLEFRFMDPDADSGIFLRVGGDTDFIRGWPGSAYQVQVRDISVNPGDRPLPLAQLYRHEIGDGDTAYLRESVFERYTGPGEWQHFEITVVGDLLTVQLNGEPVTTAHDILNPTGHIGFQSETGTVQYRNLSIHEL